MLTISNRGYLVAGLIVIVGIAGQWMGGLMAQLWSIPMALLVAAIYAERVALHSMRYDVIRFVPNEAHLGEEFTGELQISNQSHRVLHIEVQASYPDSLKAEAQIERYRVAPNQASKTHFLMTPLELGAIEMGNLYTRVLGFMGLVWWHRCINDQVLVRVIPAGLSMVPRGAGDHIIGARYSRKPTQGGIEFLSHREYHSGDPLQSVDWKASARCDELMVRIMAREQRMELAILLDCGRTSMLQVGQLSQLHQNVNIAARLSELAVTQGDHIACITYADKPLSMMSLTNGMSGLRSARAILKEAQSVPQESNLLAAALQTRRLLGHRALVVILTDMSVGDDASQFGQAVRLLSTKHMTVIASINDAEIQDMQWKRPTHWLDPYRSFAAQEYSRERELMKMHLKQHGAAIITARPDELDNKLLEYYRQLRLRIAV